MYISQFWVIRNNHMEKGEDHYTLKIYMSVTKRCVDWNDNQY